MARFERPHSKLVRHLQRAVVSVGMLALVTGAVFALKPIAPVLSLGVLYVVAVVAVAVAFGLAYAVPVSIASMLVFNWFFLPPLHSLRLRDSANWVALTVYLVTAVVVSELAGRSRRRAAEAEQRASEATLFAVVSAQLLQAEHVQDELRGIAERIGEVLRVAQVKVELESLRRADPNEQALELATGDRSVGRLFVGPGMEIDRAIRERVLPGIASLLAVAVDRERLGLAALETATLRRSDAIKTAILQAVSHDLRSPLTAIRAAAEGLASGTIELEEADRRSLLATIESEAARLDDLVTKLIDLSRLQAGSAIPRPELWTADSLVARALDAVGPEADRVEVDFPDEPPAAFVDASHIERVLANLLENALKFGDVVSVRVEEVEGTMLVSVSDDGPGLAPGEAARIFDAFNRGHAAQAGGTGLGLAIARGFAEANGGRMWVESRPGAGARFVLELPVAARAPVAG